MGMRWFLLGICILYCMNNIHCGSSEEEESLPIEESTDRLGTLFGFKPCLDERCSYYETQIVFSPSGGNDVPQTLAFPSEDDYELKDDHDYPKQHCIMLRPSVIKSFELLESQHPDIVDIKYKVLEDLINYASLVLSVRSENCTSEVKLLDLIAFSAAEIKQQYKKITHDNCRYSVILERESGTTASTTRRSGYLPPENSKPPCPETETPESQPNEKTTEKPCPGKILPTVETIEPYPEKPCPGKIPPTIDPYPEEPCEEAEIIAEEEEYNDQQSPFVGSVRGIPGVHYPNYSDVPITSFSCADKYVPGFYADLETGCQVFHVCYEHRRESFLCPVGTIFNQPILACDYWYSSNCSLAPVYYEVNAKTDVSKEEEVVIEEFIEVIDSKGATENEPKEQVIQDIAKFLPVKAKVVEFPESPKVKVVTKTEGKDIEDVASEIFEKIISTATGVASKTRVAVAKIPEPSISKYEPVPVFKLHPLSVKAPLAKAAASVTKAKLAAAVPSVIAKAKLAAAIPAAKVAVAKSVLPVVAKTKVAGAALPVAAKAKVAAAVPVVAKAKVAGAALPIVAAKAKVAAAVPIVAKAKVAGAALPVVATKAKVAAAVPVVAKAKVAGAALPVVAKAKVAGAAIPVAAKLKVAAVAPVVGKAKFAAAAAVPKVVAKASIPVLKSKLIASAVPIAKTKFAAPVLKGKALKAAGIPLVKAKMFAVPLAKSKLGGSAPLLKGKLLKAAAISPLTKKALALGYMKLLKAKKLALMG